MALTPGTRLGVYEVTAQIGEGGMGQVYRATDTKLKRQVAIKILPPSVAGDHDRLARFQREAEVLASLNHPNIAGIYGLEESEGMTALVMELVEGKDLSELIGEQRHSVPATVARGGGAPRAMSIDDALPIAKQIADALEAAHEQGIIHRDLKPANIKIRTDGTVKVLDFGLAKAMDPDGASASAIANSPTLTARATQAGMILGTAAYMSPEQAKGKVVDKRTDIWAFGVVLWELLTGCRLFQDDTIAEVLAAVLTKEPDLTAVPERVRHLLARCLEKDPKKRLRDIGDAMSLVRPIESTAPTGPTAAPARSSRLVAIGGWLMAGSLAAALGFVAWQRSRAGADGAAPVVRFDIPRAAHMYNQVASAFAVSPDGLVLAYWDAVDGGRFALFLRTLGTGAAREIEGSRTSNPRGDSLIWSPDSRRLVRGRAEDTAVIDVATGALRVLCDCRMTGGTWNRDDTILIGHPTQLGGGIVRLSTTDRTRTEITKVDVSRREADRWPVFLPDGRRFLFTRTAGGIDTDVTYVGSIDGGEPTKLAEGSFRVFVPRVGDQSAYVVGIAAGGVVAQPVDAETLAATGPVVTVLPGATTVSGSENGVLAVSAAGSRLRTIPTWVDRKGTATGVAGEAGLLDSVALSTDGSALASSEGPMGGRGNDIWMRPLGRGAKTRLTFDGANSPVWSPDGRTLAYTSIGRGTQPYRRSADGSGSETPLFTHGGDVYVNDWSLDERWILFTSRDPGGKQADLDLWVVPMTDGTAGAAAVYLAAPGTQKQAQFSPDGRFVAYGSDQGGTFDIYVQPFPDASAGKWMISNGGGVEPRWSRDGRELFYFSGQTLMTVPVSLRPTFSHGAPVKLFDAPIQAGYTNDGHRWQVAPDGKRFLLLIPDGGQQGPPLEVIVNWPALLKK